jgi:hypothetical protein
MKFEELHDLLFTEAFSNWYYTLPKDKEELLFDFYVLTGLGTPTDINLRAAYDDAIDKILKESKAQLLDSVFFAVCAEFRHIFDNNSADKLKGFFDKHGMKQFIKNYGAYYKLLSIGANEFLDRDREELRSKFADNSRGYQDGYKATMKALKANGKTKADFMEVAEKAFNDLNWASNYGGKAWARICNGWLKLNGATKPGDMIVWIDHVYDLQHNTDTVFNKLKSYYKDGYSWIKTALDKKAKIKNLYELYDNMSIGLQPFFTAVMKNVYNLALDRFLDMSKGVKVDLDKKVVEGEIGKKIDKGDNTWEGETWHFGVWKGGVWKGKIWKEGIWKNGIWENGIWEKGWWKDGTWEGGTWKNGIWEKGWWKVGTWEGGTWENGTWKGGFWEDGIWKDGVWKNGIWEGGTWKNGIWENGWIYDPKKIGNFKLDWKWDGKYVESPINPKEYFAK